MADLAVNVEQVGVPLGSLVLSAAAQSIDFTCVNRLNATVEFIADDAAFQVSDTTLFTNFERVPAGGSLVKPVYKLQTWWVKQDASYPAATLRVACNG